MSEAPSPALELTAITKRFPGVLALDDASLSVRRGEIHAVIGQNGAGKSTMINVVSGMLAPDAGEIRLAGDPGRHRLDAQGDRARHRHRLSGAQPPPQSQRRAEHRRSAASRDGRGLLDTAAMRRRAKAALDRMALDIAPDAALGALSLAERQLVEIAKALSHDPTVLVLDEPTAALGAARGRPPLCRPHGASAAKASPSSTSRTAFARFSTSATVPRFCATVVS